MADYFDEMGWQPNANPDEHQQLLLARFLIDMGFIEADDRSPPASKEVVDSLERRTIIENDNSTKCAICLVSSQVDDVWLKMPCHHEFHEKCILPWLMKRNTCPQCRYQLKTDDYSYEQSKDYRMREQERQQDIDNLHNTMFS